ncbi:MAG TPA: TIGR03667 family PPOX class F420-dependent oxidoreductase [Chloroflexi bacterium]|jgi:PPOX class probable F420-dependent enzyme|nr:TIGR03667 family PPOX class F420-dependent oxidoreductase [Chloroflexota bacterium]
MRVPARKLLDTTTPRGKHVLSRLKREIVVWLATTNPNGRPLVVPVWFLFDGGTFLIYSVPGQKVRNIGRNPLVALQLNSNPEGGDVVRVAGKAQLLKRQPPAYKVPAYIRKYRSLIKSYGWTPESFSADYRIPIRVRPTKFQGD